MKQLKEEYIKNIFKALGVGILGGVVSTLAYIVVALKAGVKFELSFIPLASTVAGAIALVGIGLATSKYYTTIKAVNNGLHIDHELSAYAELRERKAREAQEEQQF